MFRIDIKGMDVNSQLIQIAVQVSGNGFYRFFRVKQGHTIFDGPYQVKVTGGVGTLRHCFLLESDESISGLSSVMFYPMTKVMG